jgi:hypothetical protein
VSAVLENTLSDDAGHGRLVTLAISAGIVAQLRETHRQRQDLHRAEKSLTLQIKAVERRLSGAKGALPPSGRVPRDLTGDEGHFSGETQQPVANIAFLATLPLHEARQVVHAGRLKPERQMARLAKQLPVWAWVESVHGFGAVGLAQIVGEAGDLSKYSNPAKLWKRMGLAVINGESQRRKAGAAALEHGYNPIRRSIMYCIGDSLIKKQNAYRDLYLDRKQYEMEKLPEGTKLLWHRRAQRYMEKRLLRDLWRAWRDSGPELR